MNQTDQQTVRRETAAREFLNGYRFCADMLKLRRYEKRQAEQLDDCETAKYVLSGNETVWRARMYEVEHLVGSLRNGREKLILYYHYIRGESIERAADLLGVSRRTGYRLHRRGLLVIGTQLERMKKNELSFPKSV